MDTEANMDLLMLVLVLALVGLFVWLITTKIPMDPIFKTVIYIVVAIVLILWLLHKFGHNIPNFM
jgi:predicted membrane channel-forming protein YqfA (hemolysin III family)